MKLTVQDISMYYGAECEYKWDDYEDPLKILRGRITTGIIYSYGRAVKYCMPILRPLSDMTDEEAKDCAIILWYVDEEEFNKGDEWFNNIQILRAKLDIQDHYGSIGLPTYNIGFQVFKYLISKHFDVFGRINKGLAIEKKS